MKKISLFVALLVSSASWAISPKAMQTYEAALEKTLNNPSNKNILELGSDISGIARYLDKSNSADVALYSKIRTGLISIPGHAKILADELETVRREINPARYPSDYHNLRRKYIYGILSQLPSPETIQVLGNYLFDERDDPPPPDPTHFNDADPVPSSTQLAYEAIMDIGLRHPPITRKTYWAVEKNRVGHARSLARTWFNQIKAGERPFSFIGQTVEYRFKPDGTVESTPLPVSVLEQDPKPPAPAPAAPVTRPQDDVTDTRKSSPDASVWSLIAGGILALAAVFYWLRSRRTARPE